MQSQSIDGTEPVTQPEDVPLQLLLEDERKRKKQEDFDKKMAARLQKGSDVLETVNVVEITIGHCSVVEEDVSCGADAAVAPVNLLLGGAHVFQSLQKYLKRKG